MPRLCFYQYSRTRWASELPPQQWADEFMIGPCRDEDDGCEYEFAIRYFDLGGKLAAQLQVFEDAWKAFADHPILFSELAKAHKKEIQPGELRQLLTILGLTDITSKYAPVPKPGEPPTTTKGRLEMEGR